MYFKGRPCVRVRSGRNQKGPKAIEGRFPKPRHSLQGFPGIASSCNNYIYRTLKQTKREKGRVTMTNPQEIMVSSHPHRPMPGSDSPARKEWTELATVVRVATEERAGGFEEALNRFFGLLLLPLPLLYILTRARGNFIY